jgi:hypothetical protein
MRPGFNTIRITLDAERDWQHLMEQDAEEFDAKATERAMKAAAAAIESPLHVSKRTRQESQPPPAKRERTRPDQTDQSDQTEHSDQPEGTPEAAE